MRAAQQRLDSSAHHIANLHTPGFQRQSVDQTVRPGPGGVSTEPQRATIASGDGSANLADDLVEQGMSLYSFAANLKTVEAQDQMLGTLLDTMV